MSKGKRISARKIRDAWENSTSFSDWLDRLKKYSTNTNQNVRHQTPKLQTRFTKNLGPINWIGLQIVKRMQSMGYPSKIQYCYRSAAYQDALYMKRVNGKRVTNARGWQSAHQYYEAVDIVHETLFWEAPPEYWEALALCVRQVSDQYKIELEHGHNWRFVDSAHIEYKGWREQKGRYLNGNGEPRPLTQREILERFQELLPKVKFTPKEKSEYAALTDVYQ